MEFDRDLVIVDVESSSVLPWLTKPRIIEIGAVKVSRTLDVLDTFSTLVNPKCRIEEEATLIHGIRNKDVANADVWANVGRDFAKFCEWGGCRLASWSEYDYLLLRLEYQRINSEFPLHPSNFDVKGAAILFIQWFYGGKSRSFSMQSVRETLDMPKQIEMHRGLPDAESVHEILMEICEKMDQAELKLPLKV